MVGKSRMADCMLIDEIIYYENYEKWIIIIFNE